MTGGEEVALEARLVAVRAALRRHGATPHEPGPTCGPRELAVLLEAEEARLRAILEAGARQRASLSSAMADLYRRLRHEQC